MTASGDSVERVKPVHLYVWNKHRMKGWRCVRRKRKMKSRRDEGCGGYGDESIGRFANQDMLLSGHI